MTGWIPENANCECITFLLDCIRPERRLYIVYKQTKQVSQYLNLTILNPDSVLDLFYTGPVKLIPVWQ